MQSLMNFVAFQICWFANILGAAEGYPLLGILCTSFWLTLHFLFSSRTPSAEFKLILFAGISGYLADSLLVVYELLAFPVQAQFGGPSTVWMVCLWMGFAATLSHSLAWLRRKYLLAVVLGAVAGPLSYWAGSKLGAVALPDLQTSLPVVALLWAVMMPSLLVALNFFERGRQVDDGLSAQRNPL